MKKVLLLIGVILLTTVTAYGQRRWTLQECLDYAMANNLSLQKTKLSKQSATEDLKGAKGAQLPTLTGSTNQSLGYKPWRNSGTTTVTNGTLNTKVDKGYYNGSYALNAQWTVWNGNKKTNTVKLNALAEETAELAVEKRANTIQELITQLYTQILYLTEDVKVEEQMLETSKKNEERGREMLEVGKMSKADLAQLTAQRATDEYNLVEARATLLDYQLELKQLLEITDEEPLEVVMLDYTDDMILAEIPTLQSVYEQALLNRPEIESARVAIKSAGVSVSIAKAGWMPNVSMTGSLGTSTNSLTSTGWGSQMKTNVDAMAGMSVSIPIYDGRTTKTAVNKAKIKEMQAKLDLAEEQKTLYNTIQDFWLKTRTNQEKFRAAKASVASEQESYDLLQEQFRLGLKNIVELMRGKDNLLSAQQSQLQSKYMAIYNRQMLRFYEDGVIN